MAQVSCANKGNREGAGDEDAAAALPPHVLDPCGRYPPQRGFPRTRRGPVAKAVVQAGELPGHLLRQTLPRQIADMVGLSHVGVGAPFQEAAAGVDRAAVAEAGKGGGIGVAVDQAQGAEDVEMKEEAPVLAVGSSTLKRALVRPAVLTVTVPTTVSVERR